MAIFKSPNIILADQVTGINYKIIIENARIIISKTDTNDKPINVVINDPNTKKNYDLIVVNGTLTISETSSKENSSKTVLIDSITGLSYQFSIINKTLIIIESGADTDNLLEFVDKSRLEVLVIFGGPVHVNGIVRDVLSIEIDPESITIDELNEIFSNTDNLAHLYTYEPTRNENGDIYNTRIEIGEGYTILLGIEKVTRKVNPFPGKIVQDSYETVYIVRLAQMTYDEWMSSKYAPIPKS